MEPCCQLCAREKMHSVKNETYLCLFIFLYPPKFCDYLMATLMVYKVKEGGCPGQ